MTATSHNTRPTITNHFNQTIEVASRFADPQTKKEVMLPWPYKDCVLEGRMIKEDQKRDEIFGNEILAPDEIIRLLDPKVFTNAKRIDKNGEHKFNGFRAEFHVPQPRAARQTGFAELLWENTKRFLLECLDKNHLYINYSEIDDKEYGVSEEDKKLNKEFYKV